jgi:chromosome partitioning protein
MDTKIPSSTNVNKAAAMNASVHTVDRSSKISREFRALAQEVGKLVGLKLKKAAE